MTKRKPKYQLLASAINTAEQYVEITVFPDKGERVVVTITPAPTDAQLTPILEALMEAYVQ